jgi:hypothetical protein
MGSVARSVSALGAGSAEAAVVGAKYAGVVHEYPSNLMSLVCTLSGGMKRADSA